MELRDLLPENGMFRAEEGSTNPLGGVRRRRQITDVHMWVQYFAVYIGVMSQKYPEAVPELFAYIILIVRRSREFAELTWARYDSEYRRHAANSGNMQWSRINPSMYAVHFTRKALAVTPRCELCASVFHTSKDCPFSTKTEMEKTLEAVLSACTPANLGSTDRECNEVCRKWNDKRCNYQWCRYRHVCLSCGGAHPVKHCPLDQKRANSGPTSQGQQIHFHVVWQLDRKYAPAVMRANGVWEWCHVVAGLKVRKGGKIGILGTCACHTYLLFSCE